MAPPSDLTPPTTGDAAAPGVRQLLTPWPALPGAAARFGGLPPFGQWTAADLEPALRAAMLAARAEIDAIAANPAPPDFDNTLVALERSGQALARCQAMLNVMGSTLSTPEVRAAEARLAPELAAFRDTTTQNAALYRRIAAVAADSAQVAALPPEARRLLQVTLERFQREGAMLDEAGKARLKAINAELAALYTRFSQHQLADEEELAVEVSDAAELGGLGADLVAGAAAAWQAHHAKEPEVTAATSGWRFVNTRSVMEPLLRSAHSRPLREAAWRLFGSRGERAGEHDNRPLIGQILRLRQERARLLGHAHHAAWTLADNMAGTPAKAAALLERLWRAAKAKALEEIADLQAVADQQSPGGEPAAPIAPWDYRFYAEQLSVQRYQFDEAALKPYLQLDRLVAGMFWMAGENYGLRFTPLPEAAKAHPDVQVYAVTRGAPDDEGEPVGVFYLDLYARPGKRSGAWMNNYRDQHGLDGPGRAQLPIVSNNANFSPPARAGEPVLISWGDATTLFHEFGHGLHGLLSNVTYPSLAGTAVKADFVEFPSQLTEHWLHTPELLGRYARHVQTGEPLPAALLQAIQASRHFMQGMASVEYLLSALYDLRLHSLADASAVDPMAFEAALLRELDAPMALTLRHRPPHFGHIFSGDYYAAGYYVYLWADALVADAAEAFEAAPGGFYDRTLVQRLLQDILAAGNSLPPDEAFRRFRGRDVEPDALLRSRGFAVVD